LAFSFIIIYVGAIAVLFLFIVMMLDIKIGDDSLNTSISGPLSLFFNIYNVFGSCFSF
jgi:NADH:ubiquinone oxidoreductase subunit 6 (subunit J)